MQCIIQFHVLDDPGVFDQNFCLGQGLGPKDQQCKLNTVIYDIHIFSIDNCKNFLLLTSGAGLPKGP